MGTAALAVAQAWLLSAAISSAFMAGADAAALRTTFVALGVVLAGRAAIAWAQESVARRCSAAVKSELRMQLLRAATELAPRGEGPSTGEVVALASCGLDALDAYFARYLPQLVLAGIVPVVVIVVLATTDGVAAITVALTVPLIPVFMVLIGSATERRRKRRWDALARLSGHFLDVVGGLPTLRVFGRSAAQLERLERVTDDYRRESMATLRVAFLSAFALELAATLSVALVAVGVGLELVNGALDLRTGLLVVILAPEAYLPLRHLGASFHASEEGLAAAGSALAVIEAGRATERLASEGGPVPAAAPNLAGRELVLGAVTVHHLGRGLAAPYRASLTVRGGEVTGIAGASGSGKSTLINVILGLKRPDEGSVLLVGPDGESLDLADVDTAAWHKRIAWVPQHPYLFPGTVAENVRLAAHPTGDLGGGAAYDTAVANDTAAADDTAVAAALARVGLAGLDPRTRIGEGGGGVSSGQRRRIGVARALLHGGDLLILDEPTAGLDADTEEIVLAAILAAARDEGRAVLLVAHRPAALRIADRVVTVASLADRPEPATFAPVAQLTPAERPAASPGASA